MQVSRRQIAELLKLEKLCYPEAIAFDSQMMRDFLSQPGAVIVCEWRQGSLVGFQLSDRLEGTIITIDVHPAFRRRGIGKILMKRSLKFLRSAGVSQVVSQVAVDNIPSLMLHFKFGFKIQRRLPNYYGPGWDAYLLVLKFPRASN